MPFKQKICCMIVFSNIALTGSLSWIRFFIHRIEEGASYFIAIGLPQTLSQVALAIGSERTEEMAELHLSRLFANLSLHRTFSHEMPFSNLADLHQFLWTVDSQNLLMFFLDRNYRLTKINALSALIHLTSDGSFFIFLLIRVNTKRE